MLHVLVCRRGDLLVKVSKRADIYSFMGHSVLIHGRPISDYKA